MEKKLTPAIRDTYEGHKKAGRITKIRIPEIQTEQRENLGKKGRWQLEEKEQKDSSYIKDITIDEEEILEVFLEKIIKLGSSQGFVSFMSLYKYMYDKGLLSKEIPEITAQEIANHIHGKTKYRLKPKDKQAFLSSILKLSGLQFSRKDKIETQKLRKKKGKEENIVFRTFTLLKVKSYETLKDGETIVKLKNVSIMPDFIDIWYKKLSKLFIPLDDLLLISPDRNGDHRRDFNIKLAFRHAELKRDYVEWDLRQCLNAGQWIVNPEKKGQAWKQIISALEEGKKKELIQYELFYQNEKPQKLRYITKVRIHRIWQKRKHGSLGINFRPEEISPQRKTTIVL